VAPSQEVDGRRGGGASALSVACPATAPSRAHPEPVPAGHHQAIRGSSGRGPIAVASAKLRLPGAWFVRDLFATAPSRCASSYVLGGANQICPSPARSRPHRSEATDPDSLRHWLALAVPTVHDPPTGHGPIAAMRIFSPGMGEAMSAACPAAALSQVLVRPPHDQLLVLPAVWPRPHRRIDNDGWPGGMIGLSAACPAVAPLQLRSFRLAAGDEHPVREIPRCGPMAGISIPGRAASIATLSAAYLTAASSQEHHERGRLRRLGMSVACPAAAPSQRGDRACRQLHYRDCLWPPGHSLFAVLSTTRTGPGRSSLRGPSGRGPIAGRLLGRTPCASRGTVCGLPGRRGPIAGTAGGRCRLCM